MIGQLYHRIDRATLRGTPQFGDALDTECSRLTQRPAMSNLTASHRFLEKVMSTRYTVRARRGDGARVVLGIMLVLFTALIGILGFAPAP